MSILTRRTFLIASGGALTLAACGKNPGHAEPDITLQGAWMRLPPGGRDISAAYLVIKNDGGADTLLSAASPIAGDVQMHIHDMDGEVMRMRQEHSVTIPAKSTINYQPGGRHFMMFGVPDDLKAGDEIELILNFERAGAITITAIAGNGPA